jgi:hypothetical protein
VPKYPAAQGIHSEPNEFCRDPGGQLTEGVLVGSKVGALEIVGELEGWLLGTDVGDVGVVVG